MKRILASLALAAYLALGGFGFLHAYQMAGPGRMAMAPCPFMQDQEAICTMDALAHFAAWQNMFAGTLPKVFLAGAVAFCLAAFFRLRPPSGEDRQRRALRKDSSQVPPLYQLLFSRGILNPKAP